MKIYILLILSFLITLFTYFVARNNKWSILYHLFPDKYIIKNQFVLKYLVNPKYKVPIWLFILHFSQLLALIIIFILYIIFWTTDLMSSILLSYWSSVIYFIYFLLFFTTISCIHGYMYKKYIEK